LLRKRQKTLGGYFFAAPCRWQCDAIARHVSFAKVACLFFKQM